MSRAARVVCTTLAVVLVAALTAGAQSRPLRPWTLILDFVPTGEYVPHYTALEKGWYKDEGLDVKIVRGQGSADTVKRIAAGQGEVGIADISTVIAGRANTDVKVKGIALWYRRPPHGIFVRADSPIKSLKDATDRNSIAYSTNGSTSHNIVLAFVSDLGVKAKPTATGSPPATLTAVMSGQIDIGWGAPPFGIKEVNEGKIRIISRGSDVPSLRGQTVRTIIVNADALAKKRDAIMRFVKGYREAVDWMYADPKALEMYSAKVKMPVDVLKESLKEFHPKSAMQTDKMADIDGAVADAVKLKFLDAPLTEAQMKEMIVTPPAKG